MYKLNTKRDLYGLASRNSKGFADANAEATGKQGSKTCCIISRFLYIGAIGAYLRAPEQRSPSGVRV